MRVPSIREIRTGGRTVFLRADLNVPVENGVVMDESRIIATLPTLRHVLDQGSPVVLASHLGRPRGAPDQKYTMAPVAEKLSEILEDYEVLFIDRTIGPRVEAMAMGLCPGQVLVIENLRFHPGEEKNDREFALDLAKLAHIYVNDAFGTCHREHASTAGVPAAMGGGYTGLLVEKELEAFGRMVAHPRKPFTVLMGGAKVSDKVAVIAHVLPKLDNLLIGGAMAFTFIRSRGVATGRSLVEEDRIETAGEIMRAAEKAGVNLVLPVDFVCSQSPDGPPVTVPWDRIPEDMAGYDIGPESVELFRDVLMKSGTIVWNGPMGLFEVEPFDAATREIALILGDATSGGAITIVGGGDSLRAVTEAGALEKVTHASTGGGASLELLQGNELPALGHIAVKGLRPLMGANWKMNGTRQGALDFLDDMMLGNSMHFGADVVLFPPFTLIGGLSAAAEDAGVRLGGQDIHWEPGGAFTGEVSPGMLLEAGCSWFLAGHSERRHIFGETDAVVARKLQAGIAAGLKGILCVGETLAQRESGNTAIVVGKQVEAALHGISGADPSNLVVAYEPVWAIGTGKNATPEEAQKMHVFIRERIGVILGKDFAEEVRIIYGGSVTPGNSGGILSQPDVNGALVGGASLGSESFLDILASL